MSQTMLYIFPLILGRTFDLNRMQVGVDIFPKDEINNPVIIENPVTETGYKVIDNTEGARNLLDVSGAFSLNVKSGVFKAGASGAYLKDTFNRENTVEVAIKATYQTVTHTLQPKARPIKTWKQMNGIGSHYVRSITYGGELIASVRLICNNTRDKQRIKGAFEVGGRIEIFDLGVEVEGEYLSDVSKNIETMQIKVFSSIPLQNIPKDMKSLETMLNAFPEIMKKYNNGKGVPLKLELWPLEYLDSGRQKFIQNKILEAHLASFEDKFDDLLNTKAALSDWMKAIEKPLSEEHEKKVGEFYGKVLSVLRLFYNVIGKLDMSSGTNQLTPALDAYGKQMSGSFYRQYQILRQEMMNDQGEWLLEKGSGITYIHWGKWNCSKISETIFSGNAAGAGSFGGGGSNFLCLPKKLEFDKELEAQHKGSLLEEVSYKLPNGEKAALRCASCRLKAKGSLQTFVGMLQCPKDWIYIYSGLLMSGLVNRAHDDFVCLEIPLESLEQKINESPLVLNWVSIISPLNQLKKPFPCVVCAK